MTTITQVQKKTAGGTGGSNSIVITLTTPATAGNTLIAALSHMGVSTISATPPTGFAEVVSIHAPYHTRFFSKLAAGGETALTFTLGSAQHKCVSVFEYAGLSAAPVDVFASHADAGTAVTTLASGTTPNTAQDEELLFAVFTDLDPNTFVSFDNGFVKEVDFRSGTNGIRQGVAGRITTGPGAYSTTATISAASRMSAVIAAFKAAGGEQTGIPVYRWSGSAWLGPYRMKHWDGTAWV